MREIAKFLDDISAAAVWSSKPHRLIIIDAECCTTLDDVFWLAAHEWYHHLRNGGTEGGANAYAQRMLKKKNRALLVTLT